MKTLKQLFQKWKEKRALKKSHKPAPGLVMTEEARQKIVNGVKEGKPFKVKDAEGKVIYSYPEDHKAKA